MKLNLGCGLDYREDWVNHDFNKNVKADVYFDLTKKFPLEDNSFDYILLDHVIEHIPKEKVIEFMEELNRIGKEGCLIEIYTPHFTSMYAFSHLTHYSQYGLGTFDTFRIEEMFNGERYSKVRFRLIEEKLMFFHHNLQIFKFLSKIPINWLFNFGRTWQQLMEKFQFFGFDEIHYKLEVLK